MKRGALIGCGFFARNHLHAWRALGGVETGSVEIVAVCDRERDRAEALALEFGVPAVYHDPAELLARERLDFADIVTGPDSHADNVALVAGAGVNAICQKPLALSLAEARAVVKSAETVAFMVHENFRWQRPMRLLKAVAPELGRLFYGRVSFRSAHDVYAAQPYLARDERFILLDLGVHLFDLARFFFGEAATLSAQAERVNPAIRGEDVATALLKMRSGAQVVVEMSYASRLERESFPQTLATLEGEKGSAVLERGYRLVVTTDAGSRVIDASPPRHPWSRSPAEAVQDSVKAIQRHWLECLHTGREPETSGRDNLRTLELVFGAYEAAARGATLKVGELAVGELDVGEPEIGRPDLETPEAENREAERG